MLSEIHTGYSPQVNITSSEHFHLGFKDAGRKTSHHVNMAKPETQVWYLHEWFAVAGKKQHDLVTGLGWLPNKANKIWHGVQPPKVHEVAEIAIFINARPHELLLPPAEAMRLRQMEKLIAEVPKAAETVQVPIENGDRTGTQG